MRTLCARNSKAGGISKNAVPTTRSLGNMCFEVFLAFAQAACKLGMARKWSVEKIRSDAQNFLNNFWSEAYEEFRNRLTIRQPCYRPSWSDLELEFGRSEEWQQFEEELLAVAKAQSDISETNAQGEGESDSSRPGTSLSFEASEDYCSITVGETTYSLTELAGKIAKLLHSAARQERAVSRQEIQKETGCGRVWDAFRRRDGRRFWKDFVGKSERDMFTLQLPNDVRR